ncbi:MFS transporter [Streptomyces sp. NPDC015131]|uniref:MFS transporter n=1 Tax=Streptomyces sp. NPDC015131 TaxID=3364941 RepID=UPI0036F74550
MTSARMRRGRGSLAVAFFVQGVTFALLVTRIPAVQERYGISDALLPAFLAAVPVLAGVGSVAAGALVRRVAPGVVLRWAQPVVLLALAAVGAGGRMWQLAVALAVFGLAVGALDAAMNMLGVGLQRAYGRSIMLGFHAAYSLGGILGASLAWAAVHWGVGLGPSYLWAAGVLGPVVLVGSRWYAGGDGGPAGAGEPAGGAGRSLRVLAPLCLVMTFAYIGDSTVANWSALYVADVLGGSEELATVPYNAYMVTTLLGRAVGDLGVRRLGAVAVVRGGAVLAAAGFGVVAAAPGPWTGLVGFTVLGLGLSVLVPQTFAAARDDAEVARLNVFNYVGFLVGSPLVGALGEVWSHRGAMLVPLVLVLMAARYARSFSGERDRYGGGHERPRTVDVG